MKIKRSGRVKVPASSANLGPGYDVLGLGLQLYNELELSVERKAGSGEQGVGSGASIRVEIQGEGSESLPKDAHNIVWQAAKKVFEACRFTLGQHHFSLKLNNRIPLARGLGSSAAARLAGMLAANAICGGILSREKILARAAQLEGHPDNVVPALVGGLCLSAFSDGKVEFVRLDPPKNIRAVVCVPDYELSTKKARAVLPKMVRHRDAVFNLSRVSFLLGSLLSGDYRFLKLGMEDRLHQDYRKKLLPGFEQVRKNSYRAGALGVALSGAGPSVLAFATPSKTAAVAEGMKKGFRSAGCSAKSLVLGFDSKGAQVR